MRVADCMRCGTEATVLAGVCTPCREKVQKQKTAELKKWWRTAEKALKAGERVLPPGWTFEKRMVRAKAHTPTLWIMAGGLPLTGNYDFSEHSMECATEHAWGYFGMPMEVLLETCRARFGKAKKAA
jgi:hypothetical protein